MTRMMFLNMGMRIKPASSASERPAPRELQTDHLSELRPASLEFVAWMCDQFVILIAEMAKAYLAYPTIDEKSYMSAIEENIEDQPPWGKELAVKPAFSHCLRVKSSSLNDREQEMQSGAGQTTGAIRRRGRGRKGVVGKEGRSQTGVKGESCRYLMGRALMLITCFSR